MFSWPSSTLFKFPSGTWIGKRQCSVSVPDTACHWYVVDPDNTFGKGFSWITAPSFDAEGVRDIALQRQATEAQGYRTTVAWMDSGSDVPYGDDY